jgi:leucyl aminopeptidase
MLFDSAAKLKSRKSADLLVIPFWKGKKGVELATENLELPKESWQRPIELQDFKGKEGEILILYVSDQKESRFALLGLGEKEKISVERLRRAYAALGKVCLAKEMEKLNLLVPEVPHLKEPDTVKGIAEGLLLINYLFTAHQKESLKNSPPVLMQQISLIQISKQSIEEVRRAAIIAEGVYLARDIVNRNADEVNPQYLVSLGKSLAKKYPAIKDSTLGKKELEKENMGLLLAVGRASPHDPALILLDYRGNPKSKDLTAIVGKGITYDTGGLNLKVAGMETMRCDMAGAAAVLGTLEVIAKLALPINVIVAIPTAENSISPNSYKPGDIYSGYAGKTVEVGNTDAEGRLVLADALAYLAKNRRPNRMIDIATLTGGVDIALGNEVAGLMSNDDVLANLIFQAGQSTHERIWRLPIYEEYQDVLKSEHADLKNIAGGRSASSIIGAIFLQHFVDNIPWAHLDIASTAFLNEAKRYHPRFATGFGVRLLVEFLRQLSI